MRTITMSAARVAQAAAGVAAFAIPSSAYALSTTQQGGRDQARPMLLSARPASASVAYGQSTVIRGDAPGRLAGASMTLEYEPAGAWRWRGVAEARLRGDGHFALRASLPHSGRVRVVALPRARAIQPQAGARPRPAGSSTLRDSGRPAVAEPVVSRPSSISVGAAFHIADRPLSSVAGRPITLTGWLLPGTAGREVKLQAGTGRGWTPLAAARTGRYGGFSLRFALHDTGTRRLRVSFHGDRANRGATAPAGSAVGLIPAVASWYFDGGSTACGFHARYGIASRTLPCGAHVTLVYGARTVAATVDDRGPYVYGREYDLDQTTAAALGMFGVATVLASA